METASIFTFQWSDNFGTVMQAYALQSFLQKMGVSASIVPLIPDTMDGIKKYIGRTPSACLIKWGRLLASDECDRRHKFKEFREKFFNYRIKKNLSFSKCGKYSFEDKFLVFGSDNIWAPDVVQAGETQGDVFYGKSICHPYKIAYAPSAGGDLRTSPQKNIAIECIRSAGFKAISCREDATVAALKSAGIAAVRCPDPTLLLDPHDWQAIEDVSACPEEGYYFGYDLGHNNKRDISDICRELAATNSSQVRICYPNNWKKTLTVGCAPTPQQWLALINHAKGVVTNSFHGVMLSIIFRRPFVFVPIVGVNDRLNTRAYGIIDRLNAKHCIYRGDHSIADLLSQCQVDEDALYAFRKTGIDYLNKALHNRTDFI